ncbi:ATP-binding cassette domain-containing protein (plasmid) [Pantoea sp. JZ29]|uniref:ABC transporter ATP-binding protein n=1 Tax=Pantoea TaxID=53335 RepID=UPI0023F801E0|nr:MULTISPECIES: ATP-binding cassette domain-containing protein [Pantoea]MDF7788160.1 ATP-binding cassette domain-containing protein [Pantoea stewartii]WRH23079.1 ATP-binding cassette domain-containing protein [Pantoea sp. JZ29]
MASIVIKQVAVFADTCIVEPVSLIIHPGRPVTFIGETGSGKSLFAQAIFGALPDGLRAEGTVVIDGQQYNLRTDLTALRALWGHRIAALPQEPLLALDPTMRVKGQTEEGYRYIQGYTRQGAQQAAGLALDSLGLAHAAERFPWQLSGGMAQRVCFAAARAGGATLLIADEPTKGLDVARRDEIGDMLNLAVARGEALLTITHDIALARQLGGDIVVMHKGKVIEQGNATQVLNAPQKAYTKQLLAAEPHAWPPATLLPCDDTLVLRAEGLTLKRAGKTLFRNVNLCFRAGEIVGLYGESGSGKSSLGDTLSGLIKPDKGTITRPGRFHPLRYQKLYQDPSAVFPPDITMAQIIDDLLQRHTIPVRRRDERMRQLGLGQALLHRPASGLSGGELQRFSLLRAMLLNPVFLFADEPTSRLDPVVQQQTLALLTDLAMQQRCAILLVSHDLTLLERSAHRVISLDAISLPDD